MKTITEQKCIDCGQVKPVSEFHKSTKFATGYLSRCKPCRKIKDARRKTSEPTVAVKRCFTCKENKPRSDFFRRQISLDGLSPYCKSCEAKQKDVMRKRWLQETREVPALKTCSKCHVTKPCAEFFRHRWFKNGYRAECKQCSAHTTQQCILRHKQTDEIGWRTRQRQLAREWYSKNAYRYKGYYQKHRDTINRRRRLMPYEKKQHRLKRGRIWHSQKMQNDAQYRRRHNARANVRWHQRRALIRNAGSYTLQEWQDLCQKYEFKCLCCGQVKPLTVDHVMPLSKGGLNTIDNIQPLCKLCNCRKGVGTSDYRK